jgi:hypothetical protein
MRRNRLLLSCLVIFVAGVPARASAPSSSEVDALEEKLNQSHFIDPNKFGLPAGDTEELFLQRLKTIHGKEVLREKVQREQLDELIQNRNLVKEFLEKFEVSKLPAELRAKIAGREAELQDFIRSMTTEEFLKYAQEAHGIHRSSEAGGAQPGTSTPAQAAPSAGEPAQKPTTPPMGESKSQEGPASEASSTEQPANSVLGRWLLQAASRFKDLDPALRD